MEFNDWLKKSDEIYKLMNDIDTPEELLEKINIEDDFAFLQINSSILPDKFQNIINLLLERNQLDIVEKHICGINSMFWQDLLKNEKFKNIFLNNAKNILSTVDKGFDFSCIKSLISDPRGKEFFTNNAQVICSKIEGEISDFIVTMVKETDYGEKILIENQSELFQNTWGLRFTIKKLAEEGINIDDYFQGIVDNLPELIEKDYKVIYEIKSMLDNSNLSDEKLSELKEQIISSIVPDGELHDDIYYHIKIKNDTKIIKDMLDIGVDSTILEKYSIEFLRYIEGKTILEYVEICRENNWLPEEYSIKDLLQSLYKYEIEDNKIDTQTIYAVEKLITEIAENQELDPLDIKSAGSGAYSQGFKIGEYILKFGNERATNEIPYHRRLNQPLIRQQTNPNPDSKYPNMFIEVQNCVDAKWYEGMSEEKIKEELYKIYAELRDDGIIWVDVKEDNVGRLLKANEPIYIQDGQVLGRNSESTEMTDIKDEKPLQAGQLVIIDTDYIYKESEVQGKPYYKANYSYHREFEQRYEKEKAERKADTSITLKSGSVVSQSVIDFNDSLFVHAGNVTDYVEKSKTSHIKERRIIESTEEDLEQ